MIRDPLERSSGLIQKPLGDALAIEGRRDRLEIGKRQSAYPDLCLLQRRLFFRFRTVALSRDQSASLIFFDSDARPSSSFLSRLSSS